MKFWNPWHGCRKISPGCLNCYVYRRDAEFGKDSSIITRTSSFDLTIRRNRKGIYKLQPEGECVYTCMTSDFFVEGADEWKPEIWKMIRERSDLHFAIITKRIHRFQVGLPEDWGEGYDHVTICCTCENQNRADFRLPAFLNLPIRHRTLIHEPMLEQIEKHYGQEHKRQTVKRAADNKLRLNTKHRKSARYSACFVVRGFQRGLPLGTRLCSQSVVCYTLCRRCRENAVAAGEGKGI
ncbi:DUF5131 family protein [Enterocloster bolteae]|uniref:DUF5131 family protein n=2 Tax=Enterocloster bolteae TaxID=208479 RepID=UPI0034A1E1D9